MIFSSTMPKPETQKSIKEQSKEDIEKFLKHQTTQLYKKAMRGGPKCPKI